MEVSSEMIFNFILSVAIFFIGIWFKRLEKDHQEVKDEIKTVERRYQTKELAQHASKSIDAQLERIFDKLDAIEGKLDKKADK